MWTGLLAVFAVSLAVNALCSLLLIKGTIPETSVNACVYAAWGVGGLVGAMVAAGGEQRTLIRGSVLAAVSFGLAWLLGFLIFGSASFGGCGWGVLAAICGGCIAGSCMGAGKKRKSRHGTGKRNRHRRK